MNNISWQMSQSKLNLVSEHASTKFGLVGTRASPMGVCPGFPKHDLHTFTCAQPACRQTEVQTHHSSTSSFWEQDIEM